MGKRDGKIALITELKRFIPILDCSFQKEYKSLQR